MIIGQMTSAPFLLAAGVVYPFYATFKALQSKNGDETTRWLQYWMIFVALSQLEFVFDGIGAYLPLYFEAKLLFVLWLCVGRFKGATYLCEKYVEPLLIAHQGKIDEQISLVTSRASNFKVEDLGTIVNWLTTKVETLAKAAPKGPPPKNTPAAKPAAEPVKKVEEKQVEKPQDPDEPTHGTDSPPPSTINDDVVDVSEEAKKEQ